MTPDGKTTGKGIEVSARRCKDNYPVGECLHCARTRHIRGRGLCPTCYGDKGIRNSYPARKRGLGDSKKKNIRGESPVESSTSSTTRRNLVNPSTPTTSLPGTEGKIRVLEERASREDKLWNPEDARIGDSEETGGDSREEEEQWWENLLGKD